MVLQVFACFVKKEAVMPTWDTSPCLCSQHAHRRPALTTHASVQPPLRSCGGLIPLAHLGHVDYWLHLPRNHASHCPCVQSPPAVVSNQGFNWHPYDSQTQTLHPSKLSTSDATNTLSSGYVLIPPPSPLHQGLFSLGSSPSGQHPQDGYHFSMTSLT